MKNIKEMMKSCLDGNVLIFNNDLNSYQIRWNDFTYKFEYIIKNKGGDVIQDVEWNYIEPEFWVEKQWYHFLKDEYKDKGIICVVKDTFPLKVFVAVSYRIDKTKEYDAVVIISSDNKEYSIEEVYPMDKEDFESVYYKYHF